MVTVGCAYYEFKRTTRTNDTNVVTFHRITVVLGFTRIDSETTDQDKLTKVTEETKQIKLRNNLTEAICVYLTLMDTNEDESIELEVIARLGQRIN